MMRKDSSGVMTPDLDFDSSAPMLLFLLIVLDMTVGIRDIPYNSK
jgi:hypothetical protein